jgi:hypothetical protein
LKYKHLLSSSPVHPIQMTLFILIELLLIFGETFTKFNLWGPLHLYDALLLTVGIISIIYFVKQPKKFWVWPVLIILGFSLLYVCYSFFIIHNPTNYIIRHYALFVYLGLGWLIFSSFISDHYQPFNISFFVLIGVGSAVIQLIYLFYLALFTNDFSLFGDFNYYSKMTIVGIIVFGAYILVNVHNKLFKWVLAVFYLSLSVTLGHSSAFLSVFTVVITYIILQLPLRIKLAGVVALVLFSIVFFLYLPQFSDHNAEWRLVFWKYSLKDIVTNYYSILGHGFGVPYTTQETLDALRENVNSPWFEVRPEEQYLSPMHNSFITMAFHIGLLPSLLLFIPLFKPFKETILAKNELRNPASDFLLLSWVGLTVWASFNVVLELPHSSLFYWLVYFALIYQFKNKNSHLADSKNA